MQVLRSNRSTVGMLITLPGFYKDDRHKKKTSGRNIQQGPCCAEGNRFLGTLHGEGTALTKISSTIDVAERAP